MEQKCASSKYCRLHYTTGKRCEKHKEYQRNQKRRKLEAQQLVLSSVDDKVETKSSEPSKDTVKARKRRQRYRERGLCSRCGQEPPVEGGIRCLPCRDKAAQYSREAYVRRNEKLKQATKALFEKKPDLLDSLQG